MFQSARPVKGATVVEPYYIVQATVSIRAPREGRDYQEGMYKLAVKKFQSARPVKGATADTKWQSLLYPVSIRAPREGRDQHVLKAVLVVLVSIRAPREGRDKGICCPTKQRSTFQSARPVKGATRDWRDRPALRTGFNPRAP